MPNNVIVEISAINNAIQRVNKMWVAGQAANIVLWPYGVKNPFHSTPLNIDSAHDYKIEAVYLSTKNGDRSQKSTIRITYTFKVHFTHPPIVTATYTGTKRNIITTVELKPGSHQQVIVNLTKLPNFGSDLVWKAGEDEHVSLIAIGI